MTVITIISVTSLAALLVIWFIWGRDREKITITTEYYPPDDLDPMQIEYIASGDISSSSMYAMILYWISKGYLKKVEKGTIEPSVFMEKSNTGKPFADLSAALAKASKLIGHLDKIPVVSPEQVPAESILNEFISG